MWNIKSKINKQNIKTDKYRKQNNSCQRGWDWAISEKGEGIKRYRLVVKKQSQDIKYSIGNIVNHVVITLYEARWVLEIFVKYMII